ncbi:MAG: gliding motility-associated C-terminal domain-containing protein, partial [Flavobacteriales bacterium]
LVTTATYVSAQQPVWTDHYNGGLLVGNFSLGTSTFGGGTFEMPIPVGSTIRRATLYGIEVGGNVAPTLVRLNGLDHTFSTTATMTPFTYTAPPYGRVVLHALDLTTMIDPAVTDYVIVVPPSEATHNRFVDFTLLVAYERAQDDEVWTDLFWCDANSAPTESYTVVTTAPIRTTQGVAFATMASYCNVGLQDCENVAVNGTALGTFGGNDFNAVSSFGTSASMKYSGDEFIGLGDDVEDLAIAGADVLADIASLVTNGANSFEVTYTHCPSSSPDDNLMNLMLVAYSAEPCAYTVDLGPDTTLCPGEAVTLDATVPNATYTWPDGSTDPTFHVTGPGTYPVTVHLPQCDPIRDTIEVLFHPAPPSDLGADQTICLGEETMLFVPPTEGATYLWSDGEVGPARLVSGPGTFELTVILGPCTQVDEVQVYMDSCLFDVELPNVFSPNGDGTNAEFSAISLRGVREMSITVYNRWGQAVFTSNDPGFRWNGRNAAGEHVPDGTYFWVLTLVPANGPDEERRSHGSLTVVR